MCNKCVNVQRRIAQRHGDKGREREERPAHRTQNARLEMRVNDTKGLPDLPTSLVHKVGDGRRMEGTMVLGAVIQAVVEDNGRPPLRRGCHIQFRKTGATARLALGHVHQIN
eukprot:6192309-Pleurochrysis_carterae.AAC.2